MRVLVACEESQAVCKAFRALGHESCSCDIQECSGGHPEWHIKADALDLLEGHTFLFPQDRSAPHSYVEKWDMIIAFPPCTYLSNAGACRLYPKKGQLDMERYKKGLQAKEFFLKFLNADCDRIAVENPVSSSVFEMPRHTQEIQPYQFNDDGTHPYTKKQDFGLEVFRCWFRQLRDANLWGHMYRRGPEEKTVKNMVRQNAARTRKTEQRLFQKSPVLWRISY